jgi:hypothetical protein
MAGCVTGGMKGRSLRGPETEAIISANSFGLIVSVVTDGMFRLSFSVNLAVPNVTSPSNVSPASVALKDALG